MPILPRLHRACPPAGPSFARFLKSATGIGLCLGLGALLSGCVTEPGYTSRYERYENWGGPGYGHDRLDREYWELRQREDDLRQRERDLEWRWQNQRDAAIRQQILQQQTDLRRQREQLERQRATVEQQREQLRQEQAITRQQRELRGKPTVESTDEQDRAPRQGKPRAAPGYSSRYAPPKPLDSGRAAETGKPDAAAKPTPAATKPAAESQSQKGKPCPTTGRKKDNAC